MTEIANPAASINAPEAPSQGSISGPAMREPHPALVNTAPDAQVVSIPNAAEIATGRERAPR